MMYGTLVLGQADVLGAFGNHETEVVLLDHEQTGSVALEDFAALFDDRNSHYTSCSRDRTCSPIAICQLLGRHTTRI